MDQTDQARENEHGRTEGDYQLKPRPPPQTGDRHSRRDQEGAVHARLQALDPEHGSKVWERKLPAGTRRPGSPSVVTVGDRQAVALVAPSGVVTLYSLLDGAIRMAPK